MREKTEKEERVKELTKEKEDLNYAISHLRGVNRSLNQAFTPKGGVK